MTDKKILHSVVGYLVGVTVFIIAIPFGFYASSKHFDNYINIDLFSNASLHWILSGIFFVIGWFFAIWSLVVQYKIGKGGPAEFMGVEVSPKTERLVTSGPYRFTRNPMLFGTIMFYFSVGIFLNSVIAIIETMIFVIVMFLEVKLIEERRLLKEFGREYTDYKLKTSMLIPLPAKKKNKEL